MFQQFYLIIKCHPNSIFIQLQRKLAKIAEILLSSKNRTNINKNHPNLVKQLEMFKSTATIVDKMNEQLNSLHAKKNKGNKASIGYECKIAVCLLVLIRHIASFVYI